jgi:hypothetical protein
MSEDQELVRALGAWLEEGPDTAPDRPRRLAIDHARRRPRRPDPLALFRRDPMPSRSARGSTLRPALGALAVLGLLLAAMVGAAIVGSIGDGLPAPTASPTPGPSPSPSAPAPTAVPGSPAPVRVLLDTGTAATMTVLVTDLSGQLSGAASGPAAGDGGSVPPGQILVTGERDSTLRLTWTDVACSIEYRLTIEADGSSIVLEAPPCEGDAMALDRVLLLSFVGPIDPGSITTTIRPID